MATIKNSIDSIGALMDLMNEKNIASLELKDGDFSIRLEAPRLIPHFGGECIGQADAATTITAADANGAAQPCANIQQKGNVICSPIVGTFYATPAPDKEAFVAVGKEVKTGDVVFIIESMKLMNEIQSEFDGVVAEILVKNGDPVEFGQPVMRIE